MSCGDGHRRQLLADVGFWIVVDVVVGALGFTFGLAARLGWDVVG